MQDFCRRLSFQDLAKFLEYSYRTIDGLRLSPLSFSTIVTKMSSKFCKRWFFVWIAIFSGEKKFHFIHRVDCFSLQVFRKFTLFTANLCLQFLALIPRPVFDSSILYQIWVWNILLMRTLTPLPSYSLLDYSLLDIKPFTSLQITVHL